MQTLKSPIFSLKLSILRPDAIMIYPLRLCSLFVIYVVFLCCFTSPSFALLNKTSVQFWRSGLILLTSFVEIYLIPPPGWKRSSKKKKETQRETWRVCNKLRMGAYRPPLPSILLANVQAMDNKLDDIRAQICVQMDIQDHNILCVTETWLSTGVSDHAVLPANSFSVFCMETEDSGKSIRWCSMFHD